MLSIALLVVSLAVADALNPVTIAVALYLATGNRSRVVLFLAGVFGVYLLGGAALLLGPGQLLGTAVSSSSTPALHTRRWSSAPRW